MTAMIVETIKHPHKTVTYAYKSSLSLRALKTPDNQHQVNCRAENCNSEILEKFQFGTA